MQIVIGTQDGQTLQTETENTSKLIGKEIGDEIDGETIGLEGYTLKVTGGSDKQGFPMRRGIEGSQRQKRLLENGAGIQNNEKGQKRRKSVRGKRVSEEIQQLNVKVTEQGSETVETLLNQEDEEEE